MVVVMESISAAIRARIDGTPARTFVRAGELAADFTSRNAVDTALSRLADDPMVPLVRIRRGLYWRSAVSKFGKDRPSPADTVIAVAGDRGGIGPQVGARAVTSGLPPSARRSRNSRQSRLPPRASRACGSAVEATQNGRTCAITRSPRSRLPERGLPTWMAIGPTSPTH